MPVLSRAAPLAALGVAAAYLFWLTLGFEYPRVPGRLGPDAWPQIVLALLILTCIIGIANACIARPAAREQPADPTAVEPAPAPRAAPEEAVVPSRYLLVVLGFALFLAYPLALEYLGFLVATFLLMALFMIVGQWRSPLGILATSALGTLLLFYVFRGVVYVSLPLGAGPFHDWTVWVAHLLHMR